MESWEQESGPAIFKRLLVASMASVLVWRLQRDPSLTNAAFCTLLIRLSGRQMKSGIPHTASALLCGLWNYLSLCELLHHTDPPTPANQLANLKDILGFQ